MSPDGVRASRTAAVLSALRAEPGLLVGELVDRTGIELRRLAPLLWSLEDEGLLVHEGRRYFPVD